VQSYLLSFSFICAGNAATKDSSSPLTQHRHTMHLSLALRCLASSITRILVLVMLLVPLVPSSGVVVSALRFRDTSFSLSHLRSRWSAFPSRLSALLEPKPVPEFPLEGSRGAAPYAPNPIPGDHRRPLEHGKPLLPRLQPRRPPSRRAKATLPNTWIIQRIFDGESFFKYVMYPSVPRSFAHVVGAFIPSGWNFATYPDPTQCVSIFHPSDDTMID
jgi:hypothetical protein